MRVAAVQFKGTKGRKRAALRTLQGLVGQAAPGSDLVVLPELAATGYLFPDPVAAGRIAEAPDGPTFQMLSPLARAHRTWIVAGFAERAGDLLYNSALVLDPSGALQFTYRKTLLFPPDRWWCAPGNSGYRAFDTDAGRFGVGICMDLNDDLFTAWCRRANLDAIAFPTNWVEEDIEVYPYWCERLQGIDAALVAANSYGEEHGLIFSGGSAVLQGGKVLVQAPALGDAVVRATTRLAGRVP